MTPRWAMILAAGALAAACAARGRHVEPENRPSCSGPHALRDSATGRLQGRVTRIADDQPVAGVSVAAHRGDTAPLATTTDGDGQWRLGNLPEGRYRVVVHRAARILFSMSVDLCAEDVVTMRVPVHDS